MNGVEELDQLLRTSSRYRREAYAFLLAALELAARRIHGDEPRGASRHVTGPQLAEAFRDLALAQYGPLARCVLSHWRIHSTRDIGEMVFLLIEHSLLGRQESDRIEDFDDVYDFHDAFDNWQVRILPSDSESA